jgi:hypothetical protein
LAKVERKTMPKRPKEAPKMTSRERAMAAKWNTLAQVGGKSARLPSTEAIANAASARMKGGQTISRKRKCTAMSA